MDALQDARIAGAGDLPEFLNPTIADENAESSDQRATRNRIAKELRALAEGLDE